MSLFVGTDIGGTFTDLVAFDSQSGKLHFGKTLTRNDELVEGVMSCLADTGLKPEAVDILKHGTTQVINTLLERKGAKTALITTKGFRDILEIGRAGRPVVFRFEYARHPPLVPRVLRFEIDERINAKGTVQKTLDIEELDRLANDLRDAGVEAVAISLLNSYLNPIHEEQIAEALAKQLPHVYIATGSALSREWYEYERTSTAVANAFVGPRAGGYIDRFDTRLEEANFRGRFFMMASNGGVLSARRAREQPIALVESGPIGGCIGASVYAKALGIEKLIAFDMGGTTAKCALVEGSHFEVQQTYYVGGYDYGFPVRTPVLDIVEVGTGGGSIAYVDEQQRLHVGPRSAGSDPGPVSFRRGGVEPTVTDANVVLDRISGGAFLSGGLPLDREAAIAALRDKVGRPLGIGNTDSYNDNDSDRVASGILNLANVQMASAIREISIERGKDVREFTLFLFGGGGPLHGLDLARELHVGRVIVPPEPGNFSALGMLLADARVDESHTFLCELNDAAAPLLAERLAQMRDAAAAALLRDFGSVDVVFDQQAEMRYRGQRHPIRVPLGVSDNTAVIRQKFLEHYRRRYGRADEQTPMEFIGLRVAGIAATERPDITRLHRAPREGKVEAGQAKKTGRREVYFASQGRRLPTPVYARDTLPVGASLEGPAVIEEFGATTVISPGDRLRVGVLGEFDIELSI
ncbi:MAG: hydantoinase/oxoprolinase family protein [Burkholderiales bacterium]